MHQVITKVALVPGSLEKTKAFFETAVQDALLEFNSWRGATIATDSETNEIVVIGSWTDAEEMQRWLSDPRHGELMGRLAESLAGPPSVTIAKVVTEIGPNATK